MSRIILIYIIFGCILREWRRQNVDVLWLRFETEAEGRPVQVWFDKLRIEAKEEIIDLILHMRVRIASQWRLPEFDPLDGEGGISELRPNNIHCEEGSLTYRIYGLRSYPEKLSYTFLYGVRKEVKNDREGKDFAKWRLQQLHQEQFRTGRPAAHTFDFSGKSDSEIGSGNRGKS